MLLVISSKEKQTNPNETEFQKKNDNAKKKENITKQNINIQNKKREKNRQKILTFKCYSHTRLAL